MVHEISKRIVFPLIKSLFNVKLMGFEKLKKGKNYLFAMNHLSTIDIFFAYTFIVPKTNNKLHLYLSHRVYNFFLVWPVAKKYRLLKIDMDKRINKEGVKKNDLYLEQGVKRLEKGRDVLIFPEGFIHGGKIDKIIRGYSGIIRIALKAKKNITPIGIVGSNKAYPFLLKSLNPFHFNRKYPVKMIVGDEFKLEKYFGIELDEDNKKTRLLLRELTDNLMSRLSKLTGLEYRPDFIVDKKTNKLITY